MHKYYSAKEFITRIKFSLEGMEPWGGKNPVRDVNACVKEGREYEVISSPLSLSSRFVQRIFRSFETSSGPSCINRNAELNLTNVGRYNYNIDFDWAERLT